MKVRGFLQLAIGIAAVLSKLHQRGLVHKDLKPSKILVNCADGQVRLTGFNLASHLPRERQAPDPPELIAGTLAYMAPEQTGRMNRSIDARSDLYALGVTFYQMLTGSLPFTATEPIEWVHCQVARRPVAPAERVPDVPAVLSAIIMKLLSKGAEDRYQTATGLESDLQRCLAEWETHRRIDAFALGEHDTPDRLFIPEKLYGREREIATLLAALERVVSGGAPELVLVSGYSGIGKSSVVNELHKVLVPPRGLFAAGKFDQYKRDIPYATLAQAFQGLVRPLLGKSDAELAPWREALREALGPNGQLMVHLVPELEPLIGPQPPVPELPPQDAQRRFQLVFRRLLGVFARPEHPLALFLDDLQWLDTATLDLLEHLATQPELRHLLLVGAYRDNEVTPAHPLTRRLAAIRSAGGRMQEIMLAPLELEDLGRLVADALWCAPERVAPLAQLVHEKTAGNPFFTIQFLTTLAEDGLLAFDHDAARWCWDLEGIHAKGYTDNVVDLMLRKLRRLPTATQHALQLLACLGNSAAISSLSLIHGGSEAALDPALSEVVRAGLVFRQEGTYRFLHDRVQEAAYALIPEGERAAEHLRIGRLLAMHTPPEAIEETVFEVVSQLNRGAALITSAEEREQVAELNLIAGRRAKASTAYAAALTYLVAGAAMLGEDSWERRYDLTFSLELARAECEFLTGALAEAEVRLAELARRAAGLPHLAIVTQLRMELFTTLGRSDRAVEACLHYLRRVGVQWSAHPTKEEVREDYERMWHQIGSRSIEKLLDLPPVTDPDCRATMDVLTAAVTPAMFTDENLFCLVLCRMANLSLEHGNSDGSCSAYVWLGMVLGPQFGAYQAGYRFGN
jgi:predicted ATPase